MKVKCEEIIIDEYLKGNISNEFKSELLWVINEKSDNEQYLEIIFKLLKDNSEEALKIFGTLSQVARKQVIADNRCSSQQIFEGFMEELEHEPSE